MHGGGNLIYGLHVIVHNRPFAEYEVLDNVRGLCGPRSRTRTCELVLEDKNKNFPRVQQHCLGRRQYMYQIRDLYKLGRGS